MRAIETGRVVAVAATTGISGFAAPDGTVLDRSETGTAEVLVGRLPLAEGVPAGVRAGPTVEWALALAGLVAAAAVLVAGRRRSAWAAG